MFRLVLHHSVDVRDHPLESFDVLVRSDVRRFFGAAVVVQLLDDEFLLSDFCFESLDEVEFCVEHSHGVYLSGLIQTNCLFVMTEGCGLRKIHISITTTTD